MGLFVVFFFFFGRVSVALVSRHLCVPMLTFALCLVCAARGVSALSCPRPLQSVPLSGFQELSPILPKKSFAFLWLL